MTTSKLSGVIAAVATAVDAAGEPDCARSVKLARHLLDHGCDGLNVLGTTGEATSFSLDQRKRVMSAYREAGLPLDRLMVGTGAAALADAVALTRHAAELGFAGALVLPPFYYKGVPDDGLVAYIDAIVRATADKPIPLYLYHFPAQLRPAVARRADRAAAGGASRADRGPQGFLGRHALRARGCRRVARLQGVPGDRSRADGGALGPVRGLHLGDRQSQRRPVRARLARRRPAALDAAVAIRKLFDGTPARRRHQGGAGPYPRRRGLGADAAAARRHERCRTRRRRLRATTPSGPSSAGAAFRRRRDAHDAQAPRPL